MKYPAPTAAQVVALILMTVLVAACGQPAAAPTAAATSLPTDAPAPTVTPELPSAPSATTAATAQSVEPTATTTSAATGADPVAFQIAADQSEARFTLTEELRGQPTVVVGVTQQVAGEFQINPQDLSRSTVGTIQVEAASLATDNSFRNRAIRDFILNTGRYPTITFQPTALTGLSGAALPGQTYLFQMTGDLTIRDVTRPVTFEVVATGDSATQISGTATAVVRRGDFDLNIPSVPQVANVAEEVTLTIRFVAVAR